MGLEPVGFADGRIPVRQAVLRTLRSPAAEIYTPGSRLNLLVPGTARGDGVCGHRQKDGLVGVLYLLPICATLSSGPGRAARLRDHGGIEGLAMNGGEQ